MSSLSTALHYNGSAMNVAEVRTAWIGRLVDGRFPLREFLGGSDSSVVFLTELPGDEPRKAAIKLTAAEGDEADRILGAWALARAFSHPHLMQVMHSGSVILEGTRCVYNVTECADEVLSEIIPTRPLSVDETRQMLAPVLDVLAWLHGAGFVHGHIKPSNIFVVGDEIKLSADGLLAAGANRTSSAPLTIYDAPEVKSAPLAPANDLWSLGITLVETLTQQQPAWDRTTNAEPVIPASVPHPFADIARGCLRPIPTYRLPLSEIINRLEATSGPAARPVEAATLPKIVEPKPVARLEEPPKPAPRAEEPPNTAPRREEPPKPAPRVEEPDRPVEQARPAPKPEPPLPQEQKPAAEIAPEPAAADHLHTRARGFEPGERKRLSVAPMVIVFAVVLALIAVFYFRESGKSTQPQTPPSASTPETQTPSPQAAVPAPNQAAPAPSHASRVPATASGPAGSVAQRVMPSVLASAQSSIHGTVKLSVRVSVDASGKVTDATLESAGPSRYFSRVALEASRNWQFNPPRSGGQPAPSTWLLHYQFRHDGNECTPEQVAP